MKSALCVAALLMATVSLGAETTETKFIADTLVIQAEGTYEADPDLATMTFQVFSQEKALNKAYIAAAQSMQRIADLAQKNDLKKGDIVTGVLTVSPFYEGDRKKRARSYSVQGEIKLRIHDFSKIGPILEGTVEDQVSDFRSLTYSLSDEEAAKRQAIAQAMRRAVGRADAALEERGQKIGALRYMNVDVQQLGGVASIQFDRLGQFDHLHKGMADKALPPPPPTATPEKNHGNCHCTVRISNSAALHLPYRRSPL
jgi:uncharacterized protein YggE